MRWTGDTGTQAGGKDLFSSARPRTCADECQNVSRPSLESNLQSSRVQSPSSGRFRSRHSPFTCPRETRAVGFFTWHSCRTPAQPPRQVRSAGQFGDLGDDNAVGKTLGDSDGDVHRRGLACEMALRSPFWNTHGC